MTLRSWLFSLFLVVFFFSLSKCVGELYLKSLTGGTGGTSTSVMVPATSLQLRQSVFFAPPRFKLPRGLVGPTIFHFSLSTNFPVLKLPPRNLGFPYPGFTLFSLSIHLSPTMSSALDNTYASRLILTPAAH